MEKLLITGASGLIGRECMRVAEGKYELITLSRRNNIKHGLQCDILEEAAVTALLRRIKPERLLHLAWETEHDKYLNSVKNLKWPGATLNLLRAFYENGGKHAVIAGTCFEYDLYCGVLDELKTPLFPKSIYGLSKKYTYELLSLTENEMPFAWGRIFYVYGGNENENRLVPYVAQKLKSGETAVCGSGEQIRDYLYAEDVADGFLRLLEAKASGPYNICSGKTLKVKDIVNEIGAQLGKRELIIYDSARDRAHEPAVILGNNTRLRLLGWEPRVSLADGISRVLKEKE